jgi:hypothetical protein
MATQRVMQSYCIWIFGALLAAASSAVAGTKVMEFSLRDYGWQPPEPIHRGESVTVGGSSIAVDHKGRVLAGFVTRERSGLVTRGEPALYFHILRFSPDGKLDLSLSLPADGWRTNSLFLSETDQILARADKKLQLLQLDPSSGKTTWKEMAPCEWCEIHQSPSRRTLLLDDRDADPPVTVIDTSQWPKIERCQEPIFPVIFITDTFAYYSGNEETDDFPYRWPLCHYEDHLEIPLHYVGRFVVLNDQLFVVNAKVKGDSYQDRNLEVVSSAGDVKFRQAMAKREHWDSFFAPIRSSEDGRRIAVDIMTRRGGSDWLDIDSRVTARRIAVYDIETGKEVASISVNPVFRDLFEFDLSPDGRRVAILEDDVVKIVDIGN